MKSSKGKVTKVCRPGPRSAGSQAQIIRRTFCGGFEGKGARESAPLIDAGKRRIGQVRLAVTRRLGRGWNPELCPPALPEFRSYRDLCEHAQRTVAECPAQFRLWPQSRSPCPRLYS